MMLRYALAVLAILTLSFGAKPSSAQTYPAGKITIIVAFAPGGFADTMARLVAQDLKRGEMVKALNLSIR
jgi:tripartite-type tricarboxylate transporter receptor subunit TctC